MSRGQILVLSSSLLTDRMIMHGGLLPTLATHHEVEVWAASARHAEFAATWSAVPARVRPLPEVRHFREVHNYLRRVNEFAWHTRSGSFAHVSRRMRAQSTGEPRRIRVLRTAGSAVASLRLERPVEWVVERVTRTYNRSPDAVRRLEELQPSIVVTTGPHRFEEPGIVAHAVRMRIPVVALITSWDNLSTANNRMLTRYDAFLVWSENMRKELLRSYPYARSRPVYVIGAPQFDVFFQETFAMTREHFCASQGLDARRPVILYALGSPNLIRDEWQAALHLAMRIAKGELQDAQLIVRPHPLFDNDEFRDQFAHFGTGIVMQRTGQPGLPVSQRFQGNDKITEWVNSFRHADVVVNLSSTATIDAAVCDRPIVNLDYDPGPDGRSTALIREINHVWQHFRPINDSGGVWLVESPEQLLEAVRTYLAQPSLHRAGRSWIVTHVCEYADGRSGQRMAAAILDAADRGARSPRMSA